MPSTPSVRGPRYNPPTTVGTRYRPPRHQQVPGAVIVRRTVYHTPRTVPYSVIHFGTPRAYWTTVPHYYIYRRWVQWPVAYWYNDGYWDIDGYPYYVHRGYRYRYNPVEMCQYELVDGDSYTTVRTFPVDACTVAYDACATERDHLNRQINLERYFCAEAVDNDLEAKPEEYVGSVNNIQDAQAAAIAAFLADKDYRDIFDAAKDSMVGKCNISKVGGLFGMGNPHGCKYQVNVGGKAFPVADGSVCSDDKSADEIGCSVGNEKENAGCILQVAVQAGYCL
jgi:hypothetical protein